MSGMVKPEWYGDGLSNQDTWLRANTQAVTLDYFADFTCLGDRVFGLNSFCEEDCRFDINACTRQAIIRTSWRIQQELESRLGWTLTDRYHVVDLTWKRGKRLTLPFGGVEAVNIRPRVTPLPGYGPFPVDPFIVRNVPMQPAGAGCEILMPRSVVDNPFKVQIRRDTTGQATEWFSSGGAYPRLDIIAGVPTWVVGTPASYGNPPLCDEVLNILHCEMTYVDVPPSPPPLADSINPRVLPVYPGTEQIIPVIKIEALPGGNLRYWFRHRNLIDGAFEDELLELGHNELWKFIPEIDFMLFDEVVQMAEISSKERSLPSGVFSSYDEPCEVFIYPACLTILEAETGVIEVEEVETYIDPVTGLPAVDPVTGQLLYRRVSPCVPRTCQEDEEWKIRVWYKTDPQILSFPFRSAIENLRAAIVYRTAAELPLSSCGCEIKTGFISEQREELGMIVSSVVTGETRVQLRHGNRRGQQHYARLVENAPRRPKSTMT